MLVKECVDLAVLVVFVQRRPCSAQRGGGKTVDVLPEGFHADVQGGGAAEAATLRLLLVGIAEQRFKPLLFVISAEEAAHKMICQLGSGIIRIFARIGLHSAIQIVVPDHQVRVPTLAVSVSRDLGAEQIVNDVLVNARRFIAGEVRGNVVRAIPPVSAGDIALLRCHLVCPAAGHGKHHLLGDDACRRRVNTQGAAGADATACRADSYSAHCRACRQHRRGGQHGGCFFQLLFHFLILLRNYYSGSRRRNRSLLSCCTKECLRGADSL